MVPRFRKSAFVAFSALATVFPVQSALADRCSTDGAREWTVNGLSKFSKPKYQRNLSGLACAPANGGGKLCVIAQDEDFQAGVARLTPGELEITGTFNLPSIDEGGEFDAEAVAYDARGERFYVLGSHSRKARNCPNENPPSRMIVRFSFDGSQSMPVDMQEVRHISNLFTGEGRLGGKPELAARWDKCLGTKRPDDAKGTWTPEQGVNMEGLAVVDGRIFFGLRGPVLDGAAHIIKTDADAPFDDASSEAEVYSLSLSPPGGVRDLAPYGNRILILSGSEDDDHGGAAIHVWDGSSNVAKTICDIPDPEANPEALLVLDGSDAMLRILVLSDGPAGGNLREFHIKLDEQ